MPSEEQSPTAKCMEIRLFIDLTGGGNVTAGRLKAIATDVKRAAKSAVRDQDLDGAVSGDWAWWYGPWYEGKI